MKLLLVHSGADLYGASRSCLRLASRMKTDGHGVLVVLPFDGPLHGGLAQRGVEVVVRPGLSLLDRRQFKTITGLLALPFRVVRSTLFLCGVIRRFRPDVVHSNTATVFLCGGLAARLNGIPHIWHVREDFGDFAALWKIYQWLIYFLADRIVCVSQFATGQFKNSRIRRKVVVLHNGFPRDEFSPATVERVAAFRKAWNLEGKRIVALIGRVNIFRKGHLTFVEAAKFVAAKHPDVRFVLAGSPFPGNESHLDRVLEKIRELGLEDRVVYTGDVPDIHAVYSAADIVVQASGMPEGFGGVVIEAMAFGKPVVGTRLGGTIEQIADGETGLLVEPNDATAMAEAIGALLDGDNLRRRMGEAGRARFLEHFEFEPFYGKVLDLYREVS